MKLDDAYRIPKDKIRKLFSKFSQVDMSITREKGGLGLGLYLCKQIIDAHKGKIWIESEEEKGTTVYFTVQKTQYAS